MTIVIESGSTRKATSTEKLPAAIHRYSSTVTSRDADGSDTRSTKIATATPHAAHITAIPSQPARLPSLPPRNRFTAAPASASAGISQTWSITPPPASHARPSPSEQVRVVDAGRMPAPVDVHDDREPDDHLGRGDHHREEREHLPIELVVHPAERHEREVHRVQLQLDRHEDDQRVPPDEHPDRADREQHPGDDEE